LRVIHLRFQRRDKTSDDVATMERILDCVEDLNSDLIHQQSSPIEVAMASTTFSRGFDSELLENVSHRPAPVEA
jgi:hypothetical protein